MHLAQLRHQIARPVFGVTSLALREYQRELCRNRQLQDLGMVIGSGGRFGSATLATPATAAILLLAGMMLHTSRFTVAERVARMWHARRVDEPSPGYLPVRPGSEATLGDQMRTLLEEETRPACLTELIYIPELTTVVFHWGPGTLDRNSMQRTQTTYVSQDPDDCQARLEVLQDEPVRATTMRSLRGVALIWVARMIDADLTGVPMPDILGAWQPVRVAEKTEA